MRLLETFLHHSAKYGHITYNGDVVGRSFLFNFLFSPVTKFGVGFTALASAKTAFSEPAMLPVVLIVGLCSTITAETLNRGSIMTFQSKLVMNFMNNEDGLNMGFPDIDKNPSEHISSGSAMLERRIKSTTVGAYTFGAALGSLYVGLIALLYAGGYDPVYDALSVGFTNICLGGLIAEVAPLDRLHRVQAGEYAFKEAPRVSVHNRVR